MTKELGLETVGDKQKKPAKPLVPLMRFFLDPGIIRRGGVSYNPNNPSHTVTVVDIQNSPTRGK